MDKTHYKRLLNPDYIGAYALTPGQDLTVTIQGVAREMVTSAGGKKDECTVARLVSQKPLILNATNSKSIAKLYGPFIEDWVGKPITLYAGTTKFAGDVVECIRIRPQVAQTAAAPKAKEALSDARLTHAIKSIKDGTFTVARLHENFTLTDAQNERLSMAMELCE